ncbi:MAG: GNAT family N-acetyltransferase [Hyphomicrobiaceae bacterium]
MIQIRLATAIDAPTIARLNRDVQQLHAEAYPRMFKQPHLSSFTGKDARTLMARDTFITFIADLEQTAVGYTIAEERRRPETSRHFARNMMLIHEIGVAESARRRGVGRSLIAAVHGYGQSVGISLLALDTWQFNETAQAFFKSCGLSPARIMMWNHSD